MHRSFQLENGYLILPTGRRIALTEIEDWAQAANQGRQNIIPRHWRGWRIVQQYIVPPGRTMANGGIHIRHMKFLALRMANYRRRHKAV